MIELASWSALAIPGLGFRRYRGEQDLPAMLRVYRAAEAADEISGVVITTVPLEENEEHGQARVYVASVSVRRPWRRRGLARALLTGSLVAARATGFTSASLGVDSNSPTGATDLYESIGFVPERTFITYRKPLNPSAWVTASRAPARAARGSSRRSAR